MFNFFPIFMKIKPEIEHISIRCQIKNYTKIPSILVMGAINVKPILMWILTVFKIETAPANQVLGIF